MLEKLLLRFDSIFHHSPLPGIYAFLFFFFFLPWVFVAVHGLFSSCGERGLLFVAVCRLLIVVASLVREHRF